MTHFAIIYEPQELDLDVTVTDDIGLARELLIERLMEFNSFDGVAVTNEMTVGEANDELASAGLGSVHLFICEPGRKGLWVDTRNWELNAPAEDQGWHGFGAGDRVSHTHGQTGEVLGLAEDPEWLLVSWDDHSLSAVAATELTRIS